MVQRLLAASVISPALVSLSGCGTVQATAGGTGVGGREAAMLLPLTGRAADLGKSMASAASLATSPGNGQALPPIFDTQDTAEGAAAAARTAIEKGARILLGPLRADQTPAVLAVAGQVPVVTFSNDDALAGQGAFVMGVTPAQSVAAAFSYARAQGVGSVALVARDGPFGQASAAAARRVAAAGGLSLSAAILRDPSSGGLADALRSAGGGKLPDAVYIADGGADLMAFAAALSGRGVQILGSIQWGISDVTGVSDLEGAWFVAPPPDLYLGFADRFMASFQGEPGVLAAIAYDAAIMAIGLGDSRALNRKGLTRDAGFVGALGPFRFLPDGRCQRGLSILSLEEGQIVALGEIEGT